MQAKTVFDKIWDTHVVKQIENGPSVLYIDRHYIHEVTSPVAFGNLEKRGLKVFRPEKTTATMDHNIPTINQHLPIQDAMSGNQVKMLEANCEKHQIQLFDLKSDFLGIVHVIGPELGYTLPGTTIVCGDSHTSTHGAFGCIAFGIGTSEVEMVFGSQCVLQSKPKKMRINVEGELNEGVTSKDIILHIIADISSSGGTGYFIEFAGSAIRNLSMEARMSLCNMSIECGARGGLVAPDETTFAYLKGRKNSPKGKEWTTKVEEWKKLKSDEKAVFNKEYSYNAQNIHPMITYGTNPGMGVSIDGNIPVDSDPSFVKSLDYMGFKAGESMLGKAVDYVFVGSCTNGRIEDLRLFTSLVKGRKKADNITAWIVPGSKKVEQQAREEGLVDILNEAGFVLRQPGCSACLAMNDDKVPAGKYAVSTSNRNFEGRQGPGSKTLLASPLVAAAAAVTGVITNPVDLLKNKN
jgi:3-isopropylmalate/(R)-2-methylmalate dehydratase large subunit